MRNAYRSWMVLSMLLAITSGTHAAPSTAVTPEPSPAAAAQIERVYDDADYTGSLVIGPQDRPTAWTRPAPPAAPAVP